MKNALTTEMFKEAQSAFIRGDDRTAEPILQQLLLTQGTNPEVHQMLATICYNQGKFNKAIQLFKRALEIDPTYTDASVGLSIILNDLGRYDEGKKIFLEARERLDQSKGKSDPWINEKLASKHEELADLYSQYGRHNEALEQLLKAQALSSRTAEITLRVAECHLALEKPERAVKDLRQLIREYPDLLSARLKLAETLILVHKPSEAIQQWEAVLMRDPQNPQALKKLRQHSHSGFMGKLF